MYYLNKDLDTVVITIMFKTLKADYSMLILKLGVELILIAADCCFKSSQLFVKRVKKGGDIFSGVLEAGRGRAKTW